MTGVILYGPFELAPYSKTYMELLDEAGEKYDLIGWRREEEPQYTGENVFMYEGESGKRFSSPIEKIKPALGFRKFILRLIRQKKYDRLIVLTTQTALILADVLLTKYKNKYIFDYRDKSYEYIKPYGALVNALVLHSAETVISSEWFKQSLTPKKDYILAHNMQLNRLEFKKHNLVRKAENEKIVLGYIGALRSFDYHKALMDSFKNDSRFEFLTYGCGDDSEKLREYAKPFSNIFVHGAYREADKYRIVDTFDMMCYNYPSSFVNDGAVANKYYDALIMKKPMFVNEKTLLGKFIVAKNLGVGVTDADSVADTVYNWYKTFDTEKFVRTCDFYLDKYAAENELFRKKIKEVLEKAGRT